VVRILHVQNAELLALKKALEGKLSGAATNPNLRLGPRLKLILPSSGLLRSVRWFNTDVSELPIGPILKGQAVQKS
jgi:hypothetical protein